MILNWKKILLPSLIFFSFFVVGSVQAAVICNVSPIGPTFNGFYCSKPISCETNVMYNGKFCNGMEGTSWNKGHATTAGCNVETDCPLPPNAISNNNNCTTNSCVLTCSTNYLSCNGTSCTYNDPTLKCSSLTNNNCTAGQCASCVTGNVLCGTTCRTDSGTANCNTFLDNCKADLQTANCASCKSGNVLCSATATCRANDNSGHCGTFVNTCATDLQTGNCATCIDGNYSRCAATNVCMLKIACSSWQTYDPCTNSCTSQPLKLGFDSVLGTSIIQSATYPTLFINSASNVSIGTSTIDTRLRIDGGTGSAINMSNGRISNLGAPSLDNDAVTLKYINDNYAPLVGGGASLWATGATGIYNVGLGNVGIGTTTPAIKLHIIGSGGTPAIRWGYASSYSTWYGQVGSFGYGGGQDSLGGVQFLSQRDSGASNTAYYDFVTQEGINSPISRFVINYSGNVGIGTTTPGAKLDVNGGINVFTDINSTDIQMLLKVKSEVYLQLANNSVVAYKKLNLVDSGTESAPALFPNYDYGVGMFFPQEGANSAIGLTVGYSEKLRISRLGNVGISTTTPNAKLQIFGGTGTALNMSDGRISNLGSPSLDNDAVTLKYINDNFAPNTGGTGTWNLDGNTTGGTKSLGTKDNYDLPFITNNTEKMILTKAGNLIIGGPSTSGVRLHVETDQGVIAFFNSTLNGGSYAGYIGNGQVSSGEEFGLYYAINDAKIAVYDIANSLMRYTDTLAINTNNGFVGINTTDPGAYQLNVNGDTNVTGNLNVTGTISGGSSMTGVVDAGNVSAGALALNTGGGSFSMPANFSLGTTNPLDANSKAVRLYVTGSTKSKSSALLENTLITDFNQLQLTNPGSTSYLFGFGSSYTSNGRYLAASTLLDGDGVGGLSLAASNTGGIMRFYTNGNNERMRIDASGNIGINTTNTTDAKLIINAGTGMAIKAYGNVLFTGTLQTQTGSDFAEEFVTAADLEAGTVVVMDNIGYKSVKPSARSYDKTVVGIVSNNPSIIAGRVISDHKAIIAMMGVVKVKVTTTNGKVEKGDLLTTSDIEGYAMKATATKQGTVIGKALENLSDQSGEINVLVNLQ